jgi:hypothetical protein
VSRIKPHRHLFAIMLGLCLLALCRQTLAWGPLGHQLVCDIAWREMDKQTRHEVSSLIKGSRYRTFAQACNWPDHIRSDKSKDWLKPYHYINVPRGAEQVRQEHCAEQGCVLSGIERFSKMYHYADTPQKRREALLLVSHLIGDIHQPMHVSYEDDLGGNRVQLTVEGDETNLHRLWDSDILSYRYGKKADWRAIGKQLHEQARRTVSDQQLAASPLQWADESYRVTKNIYDELPANGKAGGEYAEKNYPVIEQRLKLAGMRLANYLDSLLKPR